MLSNKLYSLGGGAFKLKEVSYNIGRMINHI